MAFVMEIAGHAVDNLKPARSDPCHWRMKQAHVDEDRAGKGRPPTGVAAADACCVVPARVECIALPPVRAPTDPHVATAPSRLTATEESDRVALRLRQTDRRSLSSGNRQARPRRMPTTESSASGLSQRTHVVETAGPSIGDTKVHWLLFKGNYACVVIPFRYANREFSERRERRQLSRSWRSRLL